MTTTQETPQRTMSHFALPAFKDAYWSLDGKTRAKVQQCWLRGLRDAARSLYLYQVFPAESGADLLIWSALPADDRRAAHRFFECFARATNPVRAFVDITQTLWGYTRPSQYSKA